MEKETAKLFEGKFVKLVKKSPDPNNLRRDTFNLYGNLREITDDAVILFTDHIGVILLADIISLEEASPKKPGRDAYSH